MHLEIKVKTMFDFGRAIPEAVSRWLPTAAARVRACVWSCGICGGQSGAGAGFLRVLRFSLPLFIPPIAPQSPSSIIWGRYNRPVVAAVPSGLSLTPLRKCSILDFQRGDYEQCFNFWMLTPSSPVKVHRCFGGTYCGLLFNPAGGTSQHLLKYHVTKTLGIRFLASEASCGWYLWYPGYSRLPRVLYR
jgi:hypothetical protein